MILRQQYQNFYCFLINDNSTDQTTDILKNYLCNDARFTFFSLTDPKLSQGPADARNLGISHVSTPLTAFCDIDDLWHPSKLDKQIPFHLHKNLDISVTSFFRFNLSTRSLSSPAISPPPKITFLRVLGNNPIPMLTVLVRTSLIQSGFPPCRHEDHALWISLFSANPCLRYSVLRQPLAYYAQHSDNITRSNFKMILWALDLRSYLQLSMPIYGFSVVYFLFCHLLSHLTIIIRPRIRTRSIDSLMASEF